MEDFIFYYYRFSNLIIVSLFFSLFSKLYASPFDDNIQWNTNSFDSNEKIRFNDFDDVENLESQSKHEENEDITCLAPDVPLESKTYFIHLPSLSLNQESNFNSLNPPYFKNNSFLRAKYARWLPGEKTLYPEDGQYFLVFHMINDNAANGSLLALTYLLILKNDGDDSGYTCGTGVEFETAKSFNIFGNKNDYLIGAKYSVDTYTDLLRTNKGYYDIHQDEKFRIIYRQFFNNVTKLDFYIQEKPTQDKIFFKGLSIGVRYQNGVNLNEGFLVSGTEQQREFHRLLNRLFGDDPGSPTAPHYENVSQPDLRKFSPKLEAILGAQSNFYAGGTCRHRVYSQVSASVGAQADTYFKMKGGYEFFHEQEPGAGNLVDAKKNSIPFNASIGAETTVYPGTGVAFNTFLSAGVRFGQFNFEEKLNFKILNPNLKNLPDDRDPIFNLKFTMIFGGAKRVHR